MEMIARLSLHRPHKADGSSAGQPKEYIETRPNIHFHGYIGDSQRQTRHHRLRNSKFRAPRFFTVIEIRNLHILLPPPSCLFLFLLSFVIVLYNLFTISPTDKMHDAPVVRQTVHRSPRRGRRRFVHDRQGHGGRHPGFLPSGHRLDANARSNPAEQLQRFVFS